MPNSILSLSYHLIMQRRAEPYLTFFLSFESACQDSYYQLTEFFSVCSEGDYVRHVAGLIPSITLDCSIERYVMACCEFVWSRLDWIVRDCRRGAGM